MPSVICCELQFILAKKQCSMFQSKSAKRQVRLNFKFISDFYCMFLRKWVWKKLLEKKKKTLKEICANYMNISKGYTPVLSQTISKMMDIMQYVDNVILCYSVSHWE